MCALDIVFNRNKSYTGYAFSCRKLCMLAELYSSHIMGFVAKIKRNVEKIKRRIRVHCIVFVRAKLFPCIIDTYSIVACVYVYRCFSFTLSSAFHFIYMSQPDSPLLFKIRTQNSEHHCNLFIMLFLIFLFDIFSLFYFWL